MKKVLSMLISAAMLFSLCSCGSAKDSAISEESSTLSVVKAEPTMPEFGEYVSNTVIATGNNTMIREAKNITYRAYIPLEEYGKFEYSFYFSNNVDSTWDKGKMAYVGRKGDAYSIISAYVGKGTGNIEDEVTDLVPVTFDDSDTKEVESGEVFWSDAVELNFDEGEYLVWEWTINGTYIPSICMSGLTPSYASNGGDFYYVNEIPLPIMFGCNREVKSNIVMLGDSITQGCGTTENAYNFWASEISEKLGSEYSFWNQGLGYARASDAAIDGDWLSRVTNGDVVVVALGTNDIVTGQYGVGASSSAEEFKEWMRIILQKLSDSGCKIILFNAPPFDLDSDKEAIRAAYNMIIPELAEEFNTEFFDFASYLASPDDSSKALYGGHPNDDGCMIVADAFINEYSEFIG